MLDDGAGRLAATSGQVAEIMDQGPRGVGVEDVEVAEIDSGVLDDGIPPTLSTTDSRIMYYQDTLLQTTYHLNPVGSLFYCTVRCKYLFSICTYQPRFRRLENCSCVSSFSDMT